MRKGNSMSRKITLFLALALVVSLAAPAMATVYTWTGAVSDDGNNAANWISGPGTNGDFNNEDLYLIGPSSQTSELTWTAGYPAVYGEMSFSLPGGFTVNGYNYVPASIIDATVAGTFTFSAGFGNWGNIPWTSDNSGVGTPLVVNVVPGATINTNFWGAINPNIGGGIATVNGGGTLQIAPYFSSAGWGKQNGYQLNNGSTLNAVVNGTFDLNYLGGNGNVQLNGSGTVTVYTANTSTFTGTITSNTCSLWFNAPVGNNFGINIGAAGVLNVTNTGTLTGTNITVAGGGQIYQVGSYYNGNGPNTGTATFAGCNLTLSGVTGANQYVGNLQFAKNAGQATNLAFAVSSLGTTAGTNFAQLNVVNSAYPPNWWGDADGQISSASSATNPLADANLVLNITPGLTTVGINGTNLTSDTLYNQAPITILTAVHTDLSTGTFANVKFVGGFATVTYTSSGVTISDIFSNPTLQGDANNDGQVNGADYAFWAANYGANNATWLQGDFNNDGQVNGADYAIWAANYGTGSGTSATPEPISMIILAIGGGLVAFKRRTA
jgi:hypothetical protein